MKGWLNLHRYAMNVAWRRMMLQPLSTVVNWVVIGLALSIPMVGMSALLALQPQADSINTDPEISIFLKMNATQQEANDLQALIKKDFSSLVLNVRFVSKAQAFDKLKQTPSYADALSVLNANPLPDAVVVTLRSAQSEADVSRLVQHLQTISSVDSVQFDQIWARRLNALTSFLQTGLFFIAGVVALALLATVFNTVRMQALAQQEEIRVARLVGATEAFVRRPFLYLGALSCTISAILAIGITLIVLSMLNSSLIELAQTYGTAFALTLPPVDFIILFVLLVTLMGAFSARWSVTRSTRF